MKTQYKVAVALVAVSWFASCAVWSAQRLGEVRHPTGPGQGSDSSGFNNRDQWPRPSVAVRAAVIKVITAQLAAFKRDDYATAMTYQSDELRQGFNSNEMFRSVIRNGYPEFASCKSSWFGHGRVSPDGRHVMLLTEVTGTDGTVVRSVYFMVRQKDGYKVAGVSLNGFLGGGGARGGSPNIPSGPILPPPITSPGQAA